MLSGDVMPKKKKFACKVSVNLPSELLEWLEDMTHQGVFDSIGHGIRRCVAIAKTYLSKETIIKEETK